MAKNRWYDPTQDAFLRRRAKMLRVQDQRYGRRITSYRRLAREFTRRFGIRRSWQGIQQRLRGIVCAQIVDDRLKCF